MNYITQVMTSIIDTIDGKKTYLAGGLMIAYAVIGYFLDKGFDHQLFLEGVAVIGIGHKLTKATQ